MRDGGWRTDNLVCPFAIGSEGGTILRDEEHADGARITLEQTVTRFAITCGVYGWMVHTRFFANEGEAVAAFEEMKPALAYILERLQRDDADGGALFDDFLARFP